MKSIDLRIISSLDKTGLDQASKRVAELVKAMGTVEKAATGAARSQAQVDAASAKSAQSMARLASAQNQTAIASQKLAQSSARTATELLKQEAQMSRTALAALRLEQAVERAAKPPSKGLSGYFSGLADDLKGAALAAAGAGTAIAAVIGTVQSFGQAFAFKAQIDASRASIDAQIGSVRNAGQVWSEAAAFANQYKLTQQQTVQAVGASINVLKTSSASVGETLEALSRLNLADTSKSIEDAAFSLAELAAGDVGSIVENFRVSRDEAYAMRDAIQAGADPVAVLVDYLDRAGLSAEALKKQSEGVAGQFRDIARAQEELQLAQAELAQSAAGMLDVQIAGTKALAAALRGELLPSWETVKAGAEAYDEAYRAALASGKSPAQAQIDAIIALAQATNELSGAQASNTSGGKQWKDAQQGVTQAAYDATSALDAEAQKALVNAVNTQALAVEKDRLNDAAQRAAAMVLASGGDIVGEAARLAASSSLIDKLTAAYLRLAIAQGRAAGEQRLAGQRANTTDLTGGRGPVVGAPGRSGAGDDAIASVVKLQQEQAKVNQLIKDRQVLVGGDKARVGQIEAEIAALKRQGASESEILAKENELIGVRQRVASASSKAGGAAKSRVSAEQQAATTIIDIAEQTAEKLVEIDRKTAEARAQAQRALASDILSTSASMVAEQQANDLELIGASEDQLGALAAREAAEAQARITQIEAVSEARRIADEGDAELAGEVLAARQDQISAQQSLDEEYFKRRQALANDPALLQALEQEYSEATAAIAAQTAIAIDLARQQADQRAAAIATEKQAVVDAAAAQVAAMGKTGESASAAQGRVAALASAIASLPDKTVRINVVETRTGGASGTSSVQAAGGGTFVTNGPTHFTVGDNPGGAELVQVTPLSGAGRTRVSGSTIAMAGGGSAIVDSAAAQATALLGGVSSPIPSVARAAGGSGVGGGGGGGGSASSAEDQLQAAEDAVRLLEAMAELRKELASIGPPLNMDVVDRLAAEATQAAAILRSKAGQVSEDELDAFKRWADTTGAAIGILKDAAGLRNDAIDAGPPLDEATLSQLAFDAQQARRFVLQSMIPTAEEQVEAIQRFVDVSSSSLGVLGDAASLRQEIVDLGPPLNEATLNTLAFEAQQARRFVLQYLVPTAEETNEALQRFVDSAGASIGLLSEAGLLTADLFLDYRPPSNAQVQAFVGDANRITQAVATAAATYSTDGLEAAQAWADATGTMFSTIDSGLQTFDRLRFSDLGVDPAKLQQFVQSTSLVLDSVQGLATKASTIDMGGLSALSGVSTAVQDLGAMYGALAAVPYGNLPTGGSTTNTTSNAGPFYVTVNAAPGQDPNQIADVVMRQITQRWGSHR